MLSSVLNNKKMIMTVSAALLSGVVFGRYLAPKKVEIEIKEVEVERVVVVEKKVLVKEEVKQSSQKVNTETRTITKPDGTVIEEKVESREDITFADRREGSRSESSTLDERMTSREETRRTEHGSSLLRVSGMIGAKSSEVSSLSEYRQFMIYGAHAQYRIFGPVSVGVFGLTSKEFGVSIGIDF